MTLQQRVQDWMIECFGAEVAADIPERNFRFLEEALELVQAGGCTREDALRLVDYVYGRPAGEPAQEVGGVVLTLSALCIASGIYMLTEAERELSRVNQPEVIARIRHKQMTKPHKSPLPGVPELTPAQRAD